MSNNQCSKFQTAVDNYLIRHRSIVDVMSKYQESSARVNRAIAKAVTECGCIKIDAERQSVPVNAEYSELKKFMSSHLSGEPCENCKEIIATELGHNLFYIAALCNLCGIDLNNTIEQEYKNVTTLGMFNLT